MKSRKINGLERALGSPAAAWIAFPGDPGYRVRPDAIGAAR